MDIPRRVRCLDCGAEGYEPVMHREDCRPRAEEALTAFRVRWRHNLGSPNQNILSLTKHDEETLKNMLRDAIAVIAAFEIERRG